MSNFILYCTVVVFIVVDASDTSCSEEDDDTTSPASDFIVKESEAVPGNPLTRSLLKEKVEQPNPRFKREWGAGVAFDGLFRLGDIAAK
ncbi:hypothetical protein RB195_020075 [Necator americanus]|uniref:Uncharacterized protein n=1 Tax=Necator americanus TaxID=51031 RepID=A0ABR1CH25_NECAM